MRLQKAKGSSLSSLLPRRSNVTTAQQRPSFLPLQEGYISLLCTQWVVLSFACLPVCSGPTTPRCHSFFLFLCTAIRVLLRTLACGWNDQEASGCIHDLLQAEKSPFAGKQREPSCRAGNWLLYASLSALPNGSGARPATLSFARAKGRCEVDAGPAISKPYSSSGRIYQGSTEYISNRYYQRPLGLLLGTAAYKKE
ncbi:hypothetical protein H112_07602 [Trichophyton rubrum D6]|uniref:Uncharacterized protein n=3 Tax=Trichophyton TaxID=5550 RepID=A0A087PFI4_TRIRC|nr:uncharacterized protein TERG_11525 [Trichophyton rubrum CBS 118892]EZF11314.1 hypothetical protein H100_07629 [Trichophyton rubrum MR850]EZF38241.1 hypothetical protein H102_07593 [Trichophyton rubrum CBS 100081]EZF48793.1 hypothetical protein H103_07615 [Trichophyton rubrum CBS 288.86]EZF59382.1 hypothetical protein H104_07564 [Trichophyton rubrum CBS 289.86]EZF70096.1 hypothetical protein H105_07619 [Trichophyton soudanense CBS 452.61]EZF80715.1 hypothetical protein H110_07612 [Trichophy